MKENIRYAYCDIFEKEGCLSRNCWFRPTVQCKLCKYYRPIEKVCRLKKYQPLEEKETIYAIRDPTSNINNNIWILESGCTNQITFYDILFFYIDKSQVEHVK